MGQYYQPLLWKGEKGKGSSEYRTFSPHAYHNGAKLTEHSWMGNYFVNAVLLELQDEPQHLVWVGDYSVGLEHDLVFGDEEAENDYLTLAPDPLKYFEQNKNRQKWRLNGYMLNHTKHEFISFKVVLNDRRLKSDDGWVLNPVPILCANSNGMGGGDYWGQNKELAGTWAGDLLQYVTGYEVVPDNYRPFNPKFKE